MIFQTPFKKNVLPELTIKIIKNKIINANVLSRIIKNHMKKQIVVQTWVLG